MKFRSRVGAVLVVAAINAGAGGAARADETAKPAVSADQSAKPAARADEAAKAPDLSGTWRMDRTRSDVPQRPGEGRGSRGPRMGGGGWGGGRGGGRGGMEGGGRGGSGRGGWRGGSDRDGADQARARGPRLPEILHVTETATLVSLEDTTGAVVEEIATVAAEADTFARAPGAEHLSGRWDGDKLVFELPAREGPAVTESITLEDKGKSLVIHTELAATEERPARSFNRVYRRVTDS
jgi:hypothetical protein